MDKSFINSHILFFLSLLVCSGILIYILISHERTIKITEDQVAHTYKVINTAQEISHLVEGMLASQRGYILTKEDNFLKKFNARRNKISDLIAVLSELVSNNESQSSRVDELRHNYNEYATLLEQRALALATEPAPENMIPDLGKMDGIKDNILRINFSILKREYYFLNIRIVKTEQQKSEYFAILIAGIIGSSIILMLFHGFLLQAKGKQIYAEASLKSTEERYALAIKASQDGIFDWDLLTGQVFYSKRFSGMIGHEHEAFYGTINDFKDLLHPEDSASVESVLEKYLSREIESFTQEFRLKASGGSWVWINARAYTTFNKAGNPVRMVGALTDITPIKVAEQQLKAEKALAEEKDTAKSNFLAYMSHEIRTPLTAISGIAEVLNNKQGNLDQRQKKMVSTLGSSATILKNLINDFLDFSKIESGEVALHMEFSALDELFSEIVSIMSIRASEKRLNFILDYQEVESVLFFCDKTRLRQILINLIENALKFTEKGGVSVKAYTELQNDTQRCLRIDIADTGIGIDLSSFDLIFQKFKQGNSSVSTKYEGTGLGLPISKDLALLMGGDILFTSEVGKGSTFTVLFPLTTENHRVRHDVASSAYHEEKQKKVISLAKPLRGKKILMAEDYKDNALVLGYILEDLGFDYDIARTGAEVLQLWKENSYDLILMDIQMPEIDGFAATREIRNYEKESKRPPIPIIGMTAHALMADKGRCLSAGMNAYVPKPIVIEHLLYEILKCFDKSRYAA